VSSPAAPTDTYRWTLTALAGYARPTATRTTAAPPDATILERAGRAPRLWPVSLAFALAAAATLVVRRPRRTP
jgi:hypothetical protein